MISLGINTASSNTSIALLKDDILIAEKSWESRNNEAEKLMPAIAEMLDQANYELSNIQKIIVIKGPGSFTGLRVGVTVANAIAYLNKCELYAVDTFEYWWTIPPRGGINTEKDNTSTALLIFAGSKGVYINYNEKTEIINLYEVSGYLKNHNILRIFGDITDDQRAEIDAEFIENDESFGKTLQKLAKKQLKQVELVKPNYIKQPEITKPKKQCYT